MTIRQREKTSVDHRRRAAWPCGQQDNEHVFDFQPMGFPVLSAANRAVPARSSTHARSSSATRPVPGPRGRCASPTREWPGNQPNCAHIHHQAPRSSVATAQIHARGQSMAPGEHVEWIPVVVRSQPRGPWSIESGTHHIVEHASPPKHDG